MATLDQDEARQSTASQMADAGFLLALVFVTLFVTTFVLADDGGSSAGDAEAVAIEDLPISAAEKAQFQKMEDLEMVDAATVSAAVDANAPQDDKYSFSWIALAGTIGLAALYLGFVYRMSFKEYKEVVRARFGPPQRGSQ